MHVGDADADHGATDGGVPAGISLRGDEQAGGRDQNSDQKRHRRQDRVIRGGEAGPEGEHGHEMRGPDPGTDRHAGEHDPTDPPFALGLPDAWIDVERCQRRQRADRYGENDESIIVLLSKAR